MTFRANEAMKAGYERARRFLVRSCLTEDNHVRADEVLRDLVTTYGPVVESYPVWHPLVPQGGPIEMCTAPTSWSYGPLDHTVLFAHAFVTCPYNDGEDILDAVSAMKPHPRARIIAEKLGDVLYNQGTTAIIIRCQWHDWSYVSSRGRLVSSQSLMIPTSIAVPLMIENELNTLREDLSTPQVRESWLKMRPYMLGGPCGARSSLFVGPDTGKALQRMYNSLLDAGVYGYGPIRD
jgi:hypothetical protein